MKKIYFYFLTILSIGLTWSVLMLALTVPLSEAREFVFKYQFKNESFGVTEHSTDYNEAFRWAAQKCFTYYSQKAELTEKIGMDIIDICANPKS